MRISSISGGCLFGLLLCCACVAFGQDTSAVVSAAVSGQAGNSSVSASINPVASAADRSGGGGGRATLLGEAEGQEQEEGSMGALAAGRLEERRNGAAGGRVGGSSSFSPARFQLSALSASQKRALKRVAGSAGRQAPGFDGGLKSYSAASMGMRKEAVAISSVLKAEHTQSSYPIIAKYSLGFPDSTRGTALISPPDPGTASPLDWSPDEVGAEFPDMIQAQFLMPTLQVGQSKKSMRRRKKLEKARANGALSDRMPSALQPSLPDQLLNPSILNPSILNPPALQSPLDQPLGQQQR